MGTEVRANGNGGPSVEGCSGPEVSAAPVLTAPVEHKRRKRSVTLDGGTPELPGAGGPDVDVVSRLFALWQQVTGHADARLDAARRKLLERAVKTYGVPMCEEAIRGVGRSEFHMGRNEQERRYDDLSLIFRDAKHVEQFVGFERKHVLDSVPPWDRCLAMWDDAFSRIMSKPWAPCEPDPSSWTLPPDCPPVVEWVSRGGRAVYPSFGQMVLTERAAQLAVARTLSEHGAKRYPMYAQQFRDKIAEFVKKFDDEVPVAIDEVCRRREAAVVEVDEDMCFGHGQEGACA